MKGVSMLVLGPHISIAKGYTKAGEDALSIGATTFQFFTRNPRGGNAKALDPGDVRGLTAMVEAQRLGPLLAHAPYTLNMASATPATRDFARRAFKHDLERIKRRFTVREIKESRDIADWNAGKIPVAVIHPASAGHGLNLQAGGSTLIWFGLTWSLELYQQTNARLWRQGQASGTVVIEHIITKGTIDERILKALSQKELTQTALIDAVKANL